MTTSIVYTYAKRTNLSSITDGYLPARIGLLWRHGRERGQDDDRPESADAEGRTAEARGRGAQLDCR